MLGTIASADGTKFGTGRQNRSCATPRFTSAQRPLAAAMLRPFTPSSVITPSVMSRISASVSWRRRARRSGLRSGPAGAVDADGTWARIIDVPTNHHRELLDGMTHTLGRLKAAAEATASTPGPG